MTKRAILKVLHHVAVRAVQCHGMLFNEGSAASGECRAASIGQTDIHLSRLEANSTTTVAVQISGTICYPPPAIQSTAVPRAQAPELRTEGTTSTRKAMMSVAPVGRHPCPHPSRQINNLPARTRRAKRPGRAPDDSRPMTLVR